MSHDDCIEIERSNLKEINRLMDLVKNQEYNVLTILDDFCKHSNADVFVKIFGLEVGMFMWDRFSGLTCEYDIINLWDILDPERRRQLTNYLHDNY